MREFKRARDLRAAIKKYFDSISRVVPVTVRVPTGDKDAWGHDVYMETPAKNKLGRQVKRTEFLVPPLRSALLRSIGLSDAQWRGYATDPEFSEVVADAEAVIAIWREEQIVTRDGRSVRGVIYADSCKTDVLPSGSPVPASRPLTLDDRRKLIADMMEDFHDARQQ